MPLLAERTVDIVIVVVVAFFFLTEAHLVCQIVAAAVAVASWISKGGSLCTVFACMCLCVCVCASVCLCVYHPSRARPAGGQRVSSALSRGPGEPGRASRRPASELFRGTLNRGRTSSLADELQRARPRPNSLELMRACRVSSRDSPPS